MPSGRDLLLEIHRQIEEHFGIGQYEPTTALGSGRKNQSGIRAVSDAGEPGIPAGMRTIERRTPKQGSGEGEINRPQDSSTPEE
jgi:hypothetical protein